MVENFIMVLRINTHMVLRINTHMVLRINTHMNTFICPACGKKFSQRSKTFKTHRANNG